MFGRSIKVCKNPSKCAKCGNDTFIRVENNQIKFLNCKENHSSYYKGCPKYKELMKKEVTKTNETTNQIKNTNMVPTGFRRNYSAFVNPINSIDIMKNQINMKFIELSNQLKTTVIDSLKTQIKTSVNEMKNELLESVSSLIVKNNDKMVHFVLDVIRTIFPETTKPTEKMINIISSRLDHHKMGNISTKNLNEYVNKLWK